MLNIPVKTRRIRIIIDTLFERKPGYLGYSVELLNKAKADGQPFIFGMKIYIND